MCCRPAGLPDGARKSLDKGHSAVYIPNSLSIIQIPPVRVAMYGSGGPLDMRYEFLMGSRTGSAVEPRSRPSLPERLKKNEAHLPTQQPEAQEQARIPAPHAHARRPPGSQPAPTQGTEAPLRVGLWEGAEVERAKRSTGSSGWDASTEVGGCMYGVSAFQTAGP